MPAVTRVVLCGGVALATLALASGAAAPGLKPAAVRDALHRPDIAAADVGLHAVWLDDGAVFATHAPDRPLIPASTVKTITVACVLDTLGVARTVSTRVVADRPPDAAGVIDGALTIVGAGDPALRPEDLWSLVAELRARGVGGVTGDLVLDDTLFDSPGRPASWPPPRAWPEPYDAPQGALALAWNSVQLVVTPGPRAGAPAHVETAPFPGLAPVDASVTTGGTTKLQVSRAGARANTPNLRISGTIARAARPWREWVNLGPPTEALGRAAAELLSRAGITVSGRVRRGAAPAGGVTLASHESWPLGRMVVPIVKNSSNFGAEMLTRLLAAEAGVRPASTADGVRRLRACLSAWKIPGDGVTLADGSGYSRENRLSARRLVDVLEMASADPAWGADLFAALPRAGEDGSLRERLPELKGRLSAKTGALNGVAALAGRLVARNGRQLAFALLVNQKPGGVSVGPAQVDRLVRALARDADQAQPDGSGARVPAAD